MLTLGASEAAEDGEDSAETAEARPTAGDRGLRRGGPGRPRRGRERRKPKKPRKEPTTSVTASPVQRGDLVIPVIAEGSIRARHSAEIKFEIAGRVTHVWVTEGQRVRRGQKLMPALDDREYRLALEEAKSRYLQGWGSSPSRKRATTARAPKRLTESTAELKRSSARARSPTRSGWIASCSWAWRPCATAPTAAS